MTSPQMSRTQRIEGRAGEKIRIEVGSTGTGPEFKTPVGDAPVIPIVLIVAGAYLMWFAVKYWRGAGPAVWPSYPVKSVLQGKGIPPNQTAQTAAAQVASFESSLPQPGQTGQPPPGGPQPHGQPQNIARLLLPRYGWGPDQMTPLIALWTRESGWNPTAFNASGAYGIAQALGHGSGNACAVGARSVGSSSPGLNCAYGAQYGLTEADAKAANSGQPLPQIRWGLGYIKDRYGDPAGAWRHEQAFSWY